MRGPTGDRAVRNLHFHSEGKSSDEICDVFLFFGNYLAKKKLLHDCVLLDFGAGPKFREVIDYSGFSTFLDSGGGIESVGMKDVFILSVEFTISRIGKLTSGRAFFRTR